MLRDLGYVCSRRASGSARSRGMVFPIKSAVFPLMIIQHISSLGVFLLMLEKSFCTTEAQLAAEH